MDPSTVSISPTTTIYTYSSEIAQLDNSIGEERRQVRGEFDHQSIFKGQPRPGLDNAWDTISNIGIISIDENVFPQLNKSLDLAAKLPSTQGGGYFASLDVFHQLHCLVSFLPSFSYVTKADYPQNMIRKFTYLDYYRDQLRQHNPSMEVLEHHKGMIQTFTEGVCSHYA